MNTSTETTKSRLSITIRGLQQKMANQARHLVAARTERDALRIFLAEFSDPASDINNVSPEERAKRTRRVLNKTFN